MNFSNNKLKVLRKKKGLSQKELADQLSVSQANYSQYETGKRKPKIDTIQKIAAVLDIPITDLLDTDICFNVNSYNVEDQSDYQYQSSLRLYHYVNAIQTLHNKDLIFKYIDQLNIDGQKKAIEQLELLLKIPEYQKDYNDVPDKN